MADTENHVIEDTSTKVETEEKQVDLTSVKKKRKRKKKKKIGLDQNVEPETNEVQKKEKQMDLANGEKKANEKNIGLDQDVVAGANTVEKQEEQADLTNVKKKKKKRKKRNKKHIGLNLDVEAQAHQVEKEVKKLDLTIGEKEEHIDVDLDAEAGAVEEKEEQLYLTIVNKKKNIDLDLDADPVVSEANTVEEQEVLLDLTNVKKNKKKAETYAGENITKLMQADGDNGEEEEELDLSSMKKKKKKNKSKVFKLTEGSELFEETQFHEIEPEFDYPDDTYDELLDKVFSSLKQFHPDMVSGDKRGLNYKPPQCARVGSKKTSFINFIETCRGLKRKPKHMITFFLTELGTSGSIDGNNQFLIKGRFQQKQLESVLRRYIKEYVMCHTCKSESTLLEREARIYFVRCNMCKSSRSVSAIKSGFQAVTGKRATLRAKADS